MTAESGRSRAMRTKVQNHVTSRVGEEKVRNSLSKPHWEKPGVIAHRLDNDSLEKLSNRKSSNLWELSDPDFDGVNGVLYYEYTDQDLNKIWVGMINVHLENLRYAKDEGPLFLESLDWILSTQFEAYCFATQLDPYVLRRSIPSIVKKYKKGLVGHAKKMLETIEKNSEGLDFELNNLERLADFGYKGELQSLNEHAFVDAEKLKQKNEKIRLAAQQIAKKKKADKPKDPYFGKCAQKVRNELNNSFAFFEDKLSEL